jgi:hypothetical protein
MKTRTLLGLTVIGSAIYAHKRNGGEFTLESMKKSLQDLWGGIRGKVNDAKATAAELADRAQDKAKGVADRARSGATAAATTAATGAKDALGPAASKPAELRSPARSSSDEDRPYGSNGPVPGGPGRGR